MINVKKNSSQQGREAGLLKRNILATLTLASGLLFFSGGVSAANELTLTQLASADNGGPFQATDITGQLEGQDSFITFCVEKGETVSDGKYNYELSTHVKYNGNNTQTALSSKTAQLYSMFRDGTLADNTEFVNYSSHGQDLQLAIWNTQGFTGALSTLATELVAYVTNTTTAWAATIGNGNVRVINLTSTDENGITTNYQSQLATVPIPAAAWLFGSGLIGLAAITRKKKKA